MKFRRYSWLALGLSVVLSGCGVSQPEEATTTPPVKEFKLNSPADAGIQVEQSKDASKLKAVYQQAGLKAGPPRSDPFALKPGEKAYEVSQNMERVFASSGPFPAEFTPPADDRQAAPLPVEQQPYRRLEGIVVGDSVLAIIDMGDGTTVLIRPGQLIPGTNWRVASIDEDKAVLVRGGNVLPHQITVRLESPPPGMQQNGGMGGGMQPGGMGPGGMQPGGMPPGAMPPGMPPGGRRGGGGAD